MPELGSAPGRSEVATVAMHILERRERVYRGVGA